MQLAKVIGKATATVKHSTLSGWKLLVVQVLDQREQADGEPQIAIDNLGSSVGDKVMIAADGSAVREITGMNNTPARYIVLGQIDR
jgi:ethanolamine utilization protein EutN